MFTTSYLREAGKANEWESDPFTQWSGAGFPEPSLGSLQEFNRRFNKYVDRARAVERSSAALEKQLESLQQIEELSGLEGVFTEQIDHNQQRIWQLLNDLSRLEKELKDAQRALDGYRTKYRTEWENHEELQDTFENLNKNANEALLKNLELQIRTQFLQEDINSTKERNRKNLAEIQDYMNVLRDVQQSTIGKPSTTVDHEEEEKQFAVERGSSMSSELDDDKDGSYQLQSQKQNEQTRQAVQESYLDQMQPYREQIEDLRKKMGEAEKNLEKYANECRQVVMYQQSLEDELESYKRFIANEDYRSQSTLTDTQTTPLTASHRYEYTQVMPESQDITLATQFGPHFTSSQKGHSRKVAKRKDTASSDGPGDNGADEECAKNPSEMCEDQKVSVDEDEEEDEEGEFYSDEAEGDTRPDDVPDGAQISRIYHALCNIVRDKMRRHKRPELPAVVFYTKGHYVQVTGESSYMDPFFCTSVPAKSQVIVTFDDQHFPVDSDSLPQPDQPTPLKYNGNDNGGKGFDSTKDKGKDKSEGEKQDDRKSGANGEPKRPTLSPSISPPTPSMPEPSQVSDYKPTPFSGPSMPQPHPNAPDKWACKGASSGDKQKQDEDRTRIITPTQPLPSDNKPPEEPNYRYYEKIEMTEAVETFTDNKLQGYSETSTIVETTVEKTNQEKRTKRS
ncbi:filensin isoform X1 [Scyliorhinus canicula]|uniref:filensin isoform X1 n=1 Tax=Scyliorhinus canicula TaxID=7830 RepID=UPI0018F74649|nr:filensin isoform X1 [Scyliorhinus canicula]